MDSLICPHLTRRYRLDPPDLLGHVKVRTWIDPTGEHAPDRCPTPQLMTGFGQQNRAMRRAAGERKSYAPRPRRGLASLYTHVAHRAPVRSQGPGGASVTINGTDVTDMTSVIGLRNAGYRAARTGGTWTAERRVRLEYPRGTSMPVPNLSRRELRKMARDSRRNKRIAAEWGATR